MARLSREFYAGDTVEIARALLGKILVRRMDDGTLLAGRITEMEAYIGRCAKACHAYNYRRTERTETLFAPPGHAYIYLIYGMHHCLNFVTEPEGEPAAVLLRAIEPVFGTDTMLRLRYGDKPLSAYRRISVFPARPFRRSRSSQAPASASTMRRRPETSRGGSGWNP